MHTRVAGRPPARQDEIVRLARRSGRVEVSTLAEQFGVTTETIRRDLMELQAQRLLKRVHGGAIPWDVSDFEPRLVARDEQQVAEKRRIANAAIAELPPEGTVILDSGSTTRFVADYFPRERPLRVVTNSLPNALFLAELDLEEVVVLGGRVRRNTLAVTDVTAIDLLRSMRVDTAIIGADGVDPRGGFTTPYHEEAAIKAAMVAAARRVIVVADHTKIGQQHFRRFAGLEEVDTLITDDGAPADAVAAVRASGTSVVLA